MPPLPASPPPAIPFGLALRFWLRLGFISFGGPAGQIALMHHELVERRRWISERRFLHALNYCMVLPGPEAQQLATYLGWLMHRTPGGIAAGVLFVLPSLLILLLLSWLYAAHGNLPWVAGVFMGIKPAVVAVVAHAAWRLGRRTLRTTTAWLLAAGAFVALALLHAPFPAVLVGAALTGVLLARLAPAALHAPSDARPADAGTAHPRACIDDDTPPPPHARFSPTRLGRVLMVGALLWALPMVALVAALGAGSVFAQMGLFFSKAALLTFGGAYAVLPYVFQAAVSHYGWLGAPQMIDGLALGETTPGPLIMVVVFVAFVGGFQHPAPFEHLPVAAGVLAALVVTWVTFLPSFLFILAGGPLVESGRHQHHLATPLAAIGAAVVGVIAQLAVFFAAHVLWPSGLASAPDWRACVLALLSAGALFALRRPVTEVLAASAVAGLLLHLAG